MLDGTSYAIKPVLTLCILALFCLTCLGVMENPESADAFINIFTQGIFSFFPNLWIFIKLFFAMLSTIYLGFTGKLGYFLIIVGTVTYTMHLIEMKRKKAFLDGDIEKTAKEVVKTPYYLQHDSLKNLKKIDMYYVFTKKERMLKKSYLSTHIISDYAVLSVIYNDLVNDLTLFFDTDSRKLEDVLHLEVVEKTLKEINDLKKYLVDNMCNASLGNKTCNINILASGATDFTSEDFKNLNEKKINLRTGFIKGYTNDFILDMIEKEKEISLLLANEVVL